MNTHTERVTASGSPAAKTGPLVEFWPDPQRYALSAVERFAADAPQLRQDPAAPRVYRDLLPLTRPGPGRQYAFEVDLDRCSGCKACVSACHSLNGLEPGESWRSTGLLESTDWRYPVQQVVTTACHHCIEPGCLEGCPVLAYEKDPLTGIVRHLDDQCIGCRYCLMKCPYEVPRYSPALGIVRKCDMCSHRLAQAQPPACVQACPHEAIRITVVDTARLRALYRGWPGLQPPSRGTWFADAPDPAWTLPTTLYKTRRTLGGSLRASDRELLRPQSAHWPLIWMLVLTQTGVGAYGCASALQGYLSIPSPPIVLPLLTAGMLTTTLGLVASVFHLGRPRGAWRAFLGFRTSWLSREVVAFALFWGLGWSSLTALWMSSPWAKPLMAAACITGLISVLCSAMVYADTHRIYWQWRTTASKFLGTTVGMGLMTTLFFLVRHESPAALVAAVTVLCALAGSCKWAVDQQILKHSGDDDFSSLHKTAQLLNGRFGKIDRARTACTLLGMLVLPLGLGLDLLSGAASLPGSVPGIWAGLALALAFTGQILERFCFFVAVQPDRMPGTPTP